MSNLAMTGYGTFDGDGDVPSGRHAFSEDAVLTPIFHALTRGGLRAQRPEPALRAVAQPDPVETFRRDPLTAPIPVQALVAAVPSQPWRRALAELNPAASGRRRAGRGRHHLRLEAVGY